MGLGFTTKYYGLKLWRYPINFKTYPTLYVNWYDEEATYQKNIYEEAKALSMRETQKNYYLVFFMFASQLYFYVLGPSNLLGY